MPAFYNWIPGREFLGFAGELHHLPQAEIKSRCEELLAMVDLEEAARRRISGYSRGMRQRLGIAQALINRPQVLFLDEPCSALDPIGRRQVLGLIKQLSAGTTVFMSTHILSDVERVCDVVGIINKGKLVTTSSVEELQRRYARLVFELEFEEDSSALQAKLQACPGWINRNGGDKRRAGAARPVKDIERARKRAAGGGRPPAGRRCALRGDMPSLEDIFVELIGGGGGQ